MANILFVVPGSRGRALSSEAVRHGHSVVGNVAANAQWLTSIRSGDVDVAIVTGDPAVLSGTAIATCDAKGVRIVGLIGNDAERKNAANLGLYEIVDAGAPWDEIAQLIAPGAPLPAAAIPVHGAGTVIAVWGPAGSPGRTTLAVGIAAELAAAGHSVALCDVDTHAASIAPALGLLDEAPGFAAACRLAGTDSLSHAELERIAQRYVSSNGSFWVLTGLGRPSRWPELSADRVQKTIAECKTWVDYVVLDTGFNLENDEEISSDLFAPRRNAATITTLHEADHIVAVGAADPVGLSRFLRTFVDLGEIATTSRVTVVANKLRASAIGLNPAAQVEQTLSRFGGIDAPILVPHDAAGADAALLSGRTLAEVAPRSPARVAIAQLVQSRIVPPTAKRRAGVLAARLQRSRFEPAIN